MIYVASAARHLPGSAQASAGARRRGDVAARAARAKRLRAELALELHEAPDLGAVRTDVGLHVGGGLADGGQVDAEQLRAAVERGRDRPAEVGVVPFPGSHPRRLVERAFEVEVPGQA